MKIAVTGAATLPVGGVARALSALPQFASPRSIPRVIAVQVMLACAIVVLSMAAIYAAQRRDRTTAAREENRWPASPTR